MPLYQVLTFAQFLSIDKARVHYLLSEAKTQSFLAQELIAVGAIIEKNISLLVILQRNVLTQKQKCGFRQSFEEPYIPQKIEFVVQLKGDLALPKETELCP